jgi:hypothetical protein
LVEKPSRQFALFRNLLFGEEIGWFFAIGGHGGRLADGVPLEHRFAGESPRPHELGLDSDSGPSISAPKGI